MDFKDLNTWLGLAVLGAYIALIILIIIQHREKGDLIAALTAEVSKANANTKALDLLEPLATKVVPVALVTQINKGADLLESFTPDEVDVLIEQFRKLLNQVTDGKPNLPPAAPNVKPVG